MDDFVAIAGFDGGLVPLRTRKDFKVAFDGDAAGGKIQLEQEVGDCSALRRFAALSVNRDRYRSFHRLIIPPLSRA